MWIYEQYDFIYYLTNFAENINSNPFIHNATVINRLLITYNSTRVF